MKRKSLLIFVIIFTAATASAQTFERGINVVSGSFGFLGHFGQTISLAYERGVYQPHPDHSFGAGAVMGYAFKNDKRWNICNFMVGATGAYHYVGIKNLDLYAGLVLLGYDAVSVRYKGDHTGGARSGGLFLGGSVGFRYYFNELFGIHIEAGDGIAVLNTGLSFKF